MLLILVATPVLPQFGNPAVFAPGSTPQHQPGVVAQHEPNTNDRLFVQLLARGGLAEVEMGSAHLQQQLVSHQQTVNLLLWEIDNGQAPALTELRGHHARRLSCTTSQRCGG